MICRAPPLECVRRATSKRVRVCPFATVAARASASEAVWWYRGEPCPIAPRRGALPWGNETTRSICRAETSAA